MVNREDVCVLGTNPTLSIRWIATYDCFEFDVVFSSVASLFLKVRLR